MDDFSVVDKVDFRRSTMSDIWKMNNNGDTKVNMYKSQEKQGADVFNRFNNLRSPLVMHLMVICIKVS